MLCSLAVYSCRRETDKITSPLVKKQNMAQAKNGGENRFAGVWMF